MKGFISTASKASVCLVAFTGIFAATGNTFAQSVNGASSFATEIVTQQLELIAAEQEVVPVPADEGEPNPRNVRSSSFG